MKLGKKHRYTQLAEALGIKVGTLCRVSKVPSTTIKNAVIRDSTITADVAVKICAAYPQVNYEWLMTGEGEPLNQEGILNDPGKPYQKAKTLQEELREMGKKVKQVLLGDEDATSARAAELFARHQKIVEEIEQILDEKRNKDQTNTKNK